MVLDVNQRTMITDVPFILPEEFMAEDVNGGTILDIGTKYNVLRTLDKYRPSCSGKKTYESYKFTITGDECQDTYKYNVSAGNILEFDIKFIHSDIKNSNPICKYNEDDQEYCNGFSAFGKKVDEEHNSVRKLNRLIGVSDNIDGWLLQFYKTYEKEEGELLIGQIKNYFDDHPDLQNFTFSLGIHSLENQEHKWTARPTNIFFGNVFENEKDNLGFTISTSNPYIQLSKEVVIFETIYNAIFIPLKYKEDFEKYWFRGTLCKAQESSFQEIDSYRILCDENDLLYLPTLHFIFGNVDIFFRPANLFYYDSKFDKYISHVRFSDQFPNIIFGLPFFRTFTTFFDRGSQNPSIIVSSKFNVANVQIKGYDESNYIKVDCRVSQDLLRCPFYITQLESYQSMVLDISSKRTWLDNEVFGSRFERSTQKVEWNEGQFHFEGNEGLGRVQFGDVVLTKFRVALLNSTNATFRNVLGLSKYIDGENYHIIPSILNESKIDDPQKDKFIIQFTEEGSIGDTIASVIFGDISDLIDSKVYYKLPLTLAPDFKNLNRWPVILDYMFCGSILTHRTFNGEFNVSLSQTHFALTNRTYRAYFETIYNNIFVPFNLHEEIFKFIEDNYIKIEGQHRICQIDTDGKRKYWSCLDEDYDDNMEFGQFHFILHDGVDLYLESEDLFRCSFIDLGRKVAKCEFLIQTREDITDSFIFGLPLLKKYAIVFDGDESTSSLELISTGNKAQVNILQKEPTAEKYVKIDCTYEDFIRCPLTVGQNEYVTYDYILDISSQRTWIYQELYDIPEIMGSNLTWSEDTFEVSTLSGPDTVIYGGIRMTDFYVGEVQKDTLSEKCPFKGAIGLARNIKGEEYQIIAKALKRLKEVTGTITENKYALQFYDEGNLGKRIASVIFGDIDTYLRDKQPYTMNLSLTTVPKYETRWTTAIKQIFTGTILTNRSYSGEYNISLSVPHFNVESNYEIVTLETIHNAIFIPWNIKDQFFSFLEKKYFKIEGKEKPCKAIKNNTFVYYQCQDDDGDDQIELDQVHFVLNNNLDLFLDSEDLFECNVTNKTTYCNFLIMSNKDIPDHFVFGLPLLKKFTTVFDFNKDVKQLSLISSGNKAMLNYGIRENYTKIECELTDYIRCPLTIGDSLNETLGFVLDISSKRTWFDRKIHEIKGRKESLNWKEDMYSISGSEGQDTVILGDLKITDFYPMESDSYNTPFNTTLGLGREIGGEKYELISQALSVMGIKGRKWILQFPDDGQFGVLKPQIIFGEIDDYLEEKSHLTLKLSLSALSGQEYRWTTEVKYIFASNILVNRTFDGEYNVSLNNPHFTVQGDDDPVVPGYLETIHNVIYVPYTLSNAIFNYFQQHYFNTEGKSHNCQRVSEGSVTKYVCYDEDNDDLIEMNQVHFILEDNVDLYLDSEDLFECDTKGHTAVCTFLIQTHRDINHFVLGIPLLKKFSTVFDPTSTITKIRLISTGNKAEVKLYVDDVLPEDPGNKKEMPNAYIVITIFGIVAILVIAGLSILYILKFKNWNKTIVDGALYSQFENEVGNPQQQTNNE